MLTWPSAESKGLQDSEEERGEPQRFKFLCQCIGVSATQALTCRPNLSGLYGGGRGRLCTPPTHTPNLSDWPASPRLAPCLLRPAFACPGSASRRTAVTKDAATVKLAWVATTYFQEKQGSRLAETVGM